MAEEVNRQAEGIDFTADNAAEDFSFDPVPTQSASSTTASEMENGPPADPSASDEAAAEGANPDAAASNGAETIAEAKDGEPKTEGGEGSEVGAAPVTYGASAETPAAPAFDDSKFADDERYKSLRAQNLDARVAACLIALFDAEVFTPEDVDERAIEMLRMFRLDHAQHVLGGLLTANLIGVQNKASFLMALMRNFRDRLRQLGPEATMAAPLFNGPPASNLQSILDRTKYPMEVTIGQRKYGGPPPEIEGEPAVSAPGHEIYIGHIPKDMFEDEMIPLFEEVGRIWDLRIMMDPMTGFNRGYGFVTFCNKESAKKAAEKFDGYEIKKGKKLKVNVSVANTRLFLGNIPKSKSKEEIMTELQSLTEGVKEVIVYASPEPTSNRKNRGFCFVDFLDHKTASDAKRRLQNGRIRPWNCDLVVDWAEGQDEPDEETMAKVKVLYVRNLKESVTDETLKEVFGKFGDLERVKKVRDYAFIHFQERDPAVKAKEELNDTELEGLKMEISLAKPQMDRSKREKMRMDRDRRQGMGARGRGMPSRGGFMDFYGGPQGGRGRFQRGRGGPGGGRGRGPPDYGSGYGAYDYGQLDYYDFGGYGGYDYGAYGGGYADYGAYGGGYGYEDPYYGGGAMGGMDPYYGQPPGYDYYGGGFGGGGYGEDYYGGYSQAGPPGGYRGGRGGGYSQSGGRGGGRGGGGGFGRGGGRGGRGQGSRGGQGNRGSGGRPFNRGGQKRKMDGAGDSGGAKRMNDGGAPQGGYIATMAEPAEPAKKEQDWSADVDTSFG